ncbi:hypothetical protein [Nocardia sp. NPDC049149]|uniref:hypothetical protein n=1 Tax=Nocardia sp. NPDC049149 TaxID=3364315 RepID=UPI003719B5DC
MPADDAGPDRRLQDSVPRGPAAHAAGRAHRRAWATGAFVGATLNSLTAEIDNRDTAAPVDENLTDASESHPDRPIVVEAELTPIQASYRVGRRPDLPLGGVSTHSFFEIRRSAATFVTADTLDEVTALEAERNRLVDHHEVLHATVPDEGRQRVEPLACSTGSASRTCATGRRDISGCWLRELTDRSQLKRASR